MVGSVCSVDDVSQMDGGSFMRVRVLIDINKPLCGGRRFSSSQGEQGWVSFKNERIPKLCYWCGCLSHVDRDCELWLDSEGQLKKEEQAYGSWIRAPPFVKGSSPVIKVPGSHNSPVVAQPIIEEVEDFPVDSNDRGSNPDKEERFTGGRSAKIREDREEFEERIAERDMELNKLEKRNSVGSGLDMDSNLEDVKSGHVTQPVSNQLMHAEARFPYEDQSGSLLSQTLSRQPRVNEAELVSVPIT
uniref:Zinc knuckle CX2CX4HX4C domain-containing protein n=1 Tax=Quercus lobata TaxID=97700 RepID=A0A7N2L834_QUELO